MQNLKIIKKLALNLTIKTILKIYESLNSVLKLTHNLN